MAGFFSPGIAPAAHGARVFVPGKPARLATGRARPPAPADGRVGRGPRTVPPAPGGRDPRAPARALVAAWSRCLVPGPRALDLVQLATWSRYLVRARWPCLCLCCLVARVCDPGYKHPGPRRLVRDPCALVRAAWCMPGQVRPVGRGPRSLGRGPWTWWPVDGFMRPGA